MALDTGFSGVRGWLSSEDCRGPGLRWGAVHKMAGPPPSARCSGPRGIAEGEKRCAGRNGLRWRPALGALRAGSLGLSRRARPWARPRSCALGLGLAGSAGRPSPGSGCPPSAACGPPLPPGRCALPAAAGGCGLRSGPRPAGLCGLLGSPLARSVRGLRPSAPPAGAPCLRPAGRPCGPPGLLHPRGRLGPLPGPFSGLPPRGLWGFGCVLGAPCAAWRMRVTYPLDTLERLCYSWVVQGHTFVVFCGRFFLKKGWLGFFGGPGRPFFHFMGRGWQYAPSI